MILLKKALRSVWALKRTLAAGILLLSFGVGSYIGFNFTSIRLVATMEAAYVTGNFGDAFATVAGISASQAAHLGTLPGIAAAEPSVTADITLAGDRNLRLHLISTNPADTQNLYEVVEGDRPGRGQIAVSQNFCEAQGLSPGDVITVTNLGHELELVLSSVVISPEYISEIGEGMTGDGTISGYGYVSLPEARMLAETGDLYNRVSFLLEPGFSFEEVEISLTDALAASGLRSLYGRKDHPSHYDTVMSFSNLESMSAMIAVLFLSISALVLYIMMRRIIEQERTQIGTLKAFGFSDGALLGMYVGYGLTVGLLGGLAGLGVGIWMQGYMVSAFLTMFRMSAIPMVLDPSILLTGLCSSLFTGALGAALGVRSMLRLGPAEAMRPAAPPALKKKARGENKVLDALFTSTGFMALRGISRNRFRSAFVVLGMAISFSILTFMSSYASLISTLVMEQFEHVQRYDIKVSLQNPIGYLSAVEAGLGTPGVSGAEGILELSGTIYSGNRNKEIVLTGLEEDSSLQNIYDVLSEENRAPPREGLLLGRMLADEIGAEPGDILQIETPYTGDRRISMAVVDIVNENMGMNAYMELGSLCQALDAPKSANGLLLAASDPLRVKEQLTDADQVAMLTDKDDQQRLAQTMVDASMGLNLSLFCFVGFGIAFAIIMSTASISLSERKREYATLRVLGMRPGEIGGILLFEYTLLTLLSILPGIPLAVGFRWLMMVSTSTETMSVSMEIPIPFFVGGALCCMVAVLFTVWISTRSISRLDMAEVLKERE